MASTLPPVKGVAFSFEMSLVSQADTDTFQANPTFAAGDVKIVKDGVYDDNIDTLPTAVASCTHVITVALSATEMNADRVAVVFRDAAAAEWQDALVTIYTAAQTLDTTDGVADDIKTTVNHTDYGNAKLVRSTTPANTLDISATGEVSANTTQLAGQTVTAAAGVTFPASVGTSTYAGGAVASVTGAVGSVTGLTATDVNAIKVVTDKLATTLVLDGAVYDFTAAALAAGPSGGGGAGALSYTFTVNDGVNPIDGAEVWVSTDIAGTNVVAGTLSTDALGHVTFMLDAGAYYAWVQTTVANITNPTAFTVS